jgi:hypothetical protein
MRPMIRVFVLAAVFASASAAFALDRVAVNVPVSFETHGKTFPSGTYELEFDSIHDTLKVSSKTDTKMSYIWIAAPAEVGPDISTLSLKFDNIAMAYMCCATIGSRCGTHRYCNYVKEASFNMKRPAGAAGSGDTQVVSYSSLHPS